MAKFAHLKCNNSVNNTRVAANEDYSTCSKSCPLVVGTNSYLQV